MKYWAVFLVSARHTLASPGVIVARTMFFLVILIIFSRLWEAVGNGGDVAGISAASFVWYLALTEWMTLSVSFFWREIEEDVRRGDVATKLTRPVSYLGLKLAEGAGVTAVQLVAIGTIGLLCAWLCAGELPAHPASFLAAIPLVVLGSLFLLLLQAAIGLSAFWLNDAAPLWWISQKFLFLLGGLMFPLTLYPGWVKGIADWTPFSPLLYGCGRQALGVGPAAAVVTGLKVLAWTAALFLFVKWLSGKARRALEVHGG